MSPARKRTKIIATLGPASDHDDTLRAMIDAGLNVVRINFSHARHDALRASIARVRRVSEAAGVPVAILGDLRGPRIRVGEVAGGAILLAAGSDILLTPTPCVGTPERVGVTFPLLAGDVEPGALLLLDDGNLLLSVREVRGGADGDILAHVTRGGMLSSNRGLNLPGRRVNLPSLTDKDVADVDFAVAEGFDFLALSFVQSVEDVHGLQRLLAAHGSDIPVVAKIEKKSALDDIEAIAVAANGVMVARGDLALEMSLPEVPVAQKRIIAVCRQAACPVITATQMLESMTHAPKPTRAEATDVANAIFDGTDAVMLSGESATGEFPAETVATMSAIAARAEAAWHDGELPPPPPLVETREPESIVAHAAKDIATALGARAIITHTTSGSTTRRVACHRPNMALLALCPDERVCRRLALTWGVESERTEEIRGTAHMVRLALGAAAARVGAQPGEHVVIVAGTPYRVSGRTNLIKVETVPSADGQPAPHAS
ncbi:MAG: pyruvate kinase [Gluconacetobacter diazotrophicus]|nr:pyruvate kinase [Gluconacetobacter diazotrophicus]